MGMAVPVYYTAEMVRALPDDGNRYEVVYGELLVTPAPRLWHQVVVQRLSVALDLYLRTQPVGIVLSSPADISWGPDVLVQPDVFVATLEEIRHQSVTKWSVTRSLARRWRSSGSVARTSRAARFSLSSPIFSSLCRRMRGSTPSATGGTLYPS